jgi:hypothetical protein
MLIYISNALRPPEAEHSGIVAGNEDRNPIWGLQLMDASMG